MSLELIQRRRGLCLAVTQDANSIDLRAMQTPGFSPPAPEKKLRLRGKNIAQWEKTLAPAENM